MCDLRSEYFGLSGNIMFGSAILVRSKEVQEGGVAAIFTSAAQYDMMDSRSIKMDSFEVQCMVHMYCTTLSLV